MNNALLVAIAMIGACGPTGESASGEPALSDLAISMDIWDAKLNQVCEDFRTVRDADPMWAAYQACETECDDAQNEAYSSILSDAVYGLDADHYQFQDLMEQSDRSAAWEHLVHRYEESTEDIDRLALLSAMTRTRGLTIQSLPDSAFEEFDAMPTAEKALLLEMHATVPLPPKARKITRELAVDFGVDTGLRSAAGVALGHRVTSSELASVVSEYRSREAIDRPVAQRFGTALGRCGDSCIETIYELVQSHRRWERHAGYLAASRVPDASKASLLSTIRSGLSEEEMLYVERSMGGSR